MPDERREGDSRAVTHQDVHMVAEYCLGMHMDTSMLGGLQNCFNYGRDVDRTNAAHASPRPEGEVGIQSTRMVRHWRR